MGSNQCPNCGRVISPTANICPSCKTKIHHNKATDPNYNADGSRKTVALDEKRLKNKGSTAKTIISIIVILVIIGIVLHFVFLDDLIKFAETQKWGWYYWILTGEKFTGCFIARLLG